MDAVILSMIEEVQSDLDGLLESQRTAHFDNICWICIRIRAARDTLAVLEQMLEEELEAYDANSEGLPVDASDDFLRLDLLG